MKNSLKNLIALAILVSCFTGCKKGEDDPLISLKTRRARVTGDWHVTGGKYAENGKSQNNERVTEFTYTNNSYAEFESTTYSNGGSGVQTLINSSTGDFEYKLNFKHNGEITFIQTIDNETVIKTGTWNFTGGVGEVKNKEQLVIHYNNISSSLGGSATITGNATDVTYNIKELRNKKMVIYSTSAETESDYSNTYSEEYTLEQ